MTPQPMSNELMLAATRGPDPDAWRNARLKALTLGNAAQQQQLGQQQLQAGQLQLEQTRRDMADQTTIRQLFGANNGDLDKTYLAAAQAGVSPKTLMALQNSNIEQKKNYAALDKDRLANTISGHDIAGGSLKSYIANTDLGTKQYGWDDWINEQVKDGHLTPEDAAHFRGPYSDERAGQLALGLNTSTILAKNENDQRNSLADKARADAEVAGKQGERDLSVGQLVSGATTQAQLDNVLSYAKTVVSPAMAARLPQTIDQVPDFARTAVTPMLRAQTEQEQTKADLQTLQFNLRKNFSAQGVSNAVNSMSIFRGHPVETQDAITTGNNVLLATGDPEKVLTAINENANRLRQFTPGVIQGDAQKAAASAWATKPVQEALENSRNALSQGDVAKKNYFDSLADQRETLTNAKTIQDMLDLSRGGNATAAQQVKAMASQFANAMQGIKARGNNNPDIANAWQKGMAAAKGAFDGIPLDIETINALTPVVQTIANGATSLHNAHVDAINQTYSREPAQQFAHEPLPYRGQAAPVPVLPSQLSAADVGKTYRNRAGRNITILKVDPSDGTRYVSKDAQ